MTQERDPYDALGLPRSATGAQVKTRYHTLARELHPDANLAADRTTLEANKRRLIDVTRAYERIRRERQPAAAAPSQDQDAADAQRAATEHATNARERRKARERTAAQAKEYGDRIRGRTYQRSAHYTPPQQTSPPSKPPPPPKPPPAQPPRRTPGPGRAGAYPHWQGQPAPEAPHSLTFARVLSWLGVAVYAIGAAIVAIFALVAGWIAFCAAMFAVGFLVIAVPGFILLLLLKALSAH